MRPLVVILMLVPVGVWLPAVARAEGTKPVGESELLAETQCSDLGGEPWLVQLWSREYANPGAERLGYHTVDLRVVAREKEGSKREKLLWQDLPAFSVAGPVMRQLVYWRGALACSNKAGEVHLVIAESASRSVLVSHYTLDLDSSGSPQSIDPLKLGREGYPPRKRPRPSAWKEQELWTEEEAPWAVGIEILGSRLFVVLAFEARVLKPVYLELDLRAQKFTEVTAEQLPRAVSLPKGAATGLARLLQSETLGETQCPSAEGVELGLTLKRRSYISPPEALRSEAGTQLILEIAPSATVGEVVWGSFLNTGQARAAATRWSAAMKCDPVNRRVLIYVLQASRGDFEIYRYTATLNSAAAATIPAENATPWKFLVSFRIGDLPNYFREDNAELAATIRGIQPAERGGKEFLELVHEPPTAHEYDLDCDNPGWGLKKVPVRPEATN